MVAEPCPRFRGSAMASLSEEKGRIESFDGSDPGMYRRWKRRAQLMLAALPSTVSEAKYGPRLMEFIKGEAETLLEQIPVDDLTQTGGDKKIWAILDEKFGPQPRDLLQLALRGFFYELQVKPSETFPQFLARFDSANRLLVEQEIKLPSQVLGYMLLKKLRLESGQESMVMTHTQGKLEFEELQRAVRAIFPDGKGSVRKDKEKDVFQADVQFGTDELAMVDDDTDMNEVAELIALEHQQAGGEDDEEALEAFESYLDVRRKLREQKVSRGFSQPGDSRPGAQWRLNGTVKGRIEMLKGRTTCHICRQKGHWKRECPRNPSNQKGTSSASSSKGSQQEVHVSELIGREALLVEDVWKLFKIDEGSSGCTKNEPVSGSPTLESANDSFFTEAFVNDSQCTDAVEAQGIDPVLGQCAVPDTACRRTLVGAYTLSQLERYLGIQGLKVIRRHESSEFRFGNAETLRSHEIALIPGCLGGKRFLIKASILPGTGRQTPLLLSKEFLKQLGCSINLVDDCLHVFGESFPFETTGNGHYAIRCFDFQHGCMMVEKRAEIVTRLRHSPTSTADRPDSANGSHGQGIHVRAPADDRESQGQEQASFRPLEDQRQGFGRGARQDGGWHGTGDRWINDHEAGQVQDRSHVLVDHLRGGQILCRLGENPHHPNQWDGSPGPQGLCPDSRPSEDGSPDHGGEQVQDDEAEGEASSVNRANVSNSQDVPTKGGDSGDHGMGICGHEPGPTDHRDRDGGRCADPSCGSHSAEPDSPGQGTPQGDDQPDLGGGDTVRVMSKKNRVGLQKNVNQWCDCHVDGVVNHEQGSAWHDIFIVNTQGLTDFSEVFSMPRILPAAEKSGLKGLRSYDIGQGWDFLKAESRKKCLAEIEHYKPACVVVCPPCGPFSTMQQCSMNKQDAGEYKKKMIEARVLLDFAMQVCEVQRAGGRTFVFEQPLRASSWEEPSVVTMRPKHDIHEFVFDQCCYGLKDPVSNKYYRKRTKIMTNSETFKDMCCECSQDHEHERLEGKVKVGGRWVNRTRLAQVYPKRLVDMFVRCMWKDKKSKAHEVLASEALQEDRTDLERSVRRCHVNLGHPSRERFLHMLKSAGASNKAIMYAKKLQCSVCETHKPYPSHAVSKHKRAEGFNQQLNLDTFQVPIFQGKNLNMLNMICEGTGLQICTPLWKGCNSKEIRSAYRKYWKRWAGSPMRVFTDGGTEFDGVVQSGFDEDVVYTDKSAAYSLWQNGMVERHGGIWKTIFKKAFSESQPMNKKEVNELIDHVNQSKNSMTRKHGYSPFQHVFGCEIRLPQGLLDDNPSIPYHSGVLHGDEEMARANALRHAARKAMVEADNDDKVRRAIVHRPRVARAQELAVGDFVYYWRKYRDDGKAGLWRGPARIIGFYDGRSKLWVNYGNKVIRCAPEQVRRLTCDQEAALRFVTEDMIAARRRLSDRGAQVFVDISQEEYPSADSEPSAEERELPEAKRQRRHESLEEPGDDERQGEADEARLALENAAMVPIESEEEETQPPTEESVHGEDSLATQGGSRRDSVSSIQQDQQPTHASLPGSASAPSAYGPVRGIEPPPTALTEALRRSTEFLDAGRMRVSRTPYEREGPNAEREFDAMLVDEMESQDCFLATQKRDSELKNKDIAEHEWEQVLLGNEKSLTN